MTGNRNKDYELINRYAIDCKQIVIDDGEIAVYATARLAGKLRFLGGGVVGGVGSCPPCADQSTP